MKKFTFFWMAAIALMVGATMAACSKDEVAGIEPDSDSDFYTVKIGWEGEIIDVTYEPLDTRATTDDLYGIQVYSTPDKELDEGETTTWTPYAYGLFDDPNNISINLLKGYKYKFVATMVRDGKNKVKEHNDSYYMPFNNSKNEYVVLNNSFDYQSSIYFSRLDYGQTLLSNYNDGYVHPNTDRFYGELVNYTPGDKNATAKINMKRTAFGAKFIAKGAKAKEGTLHVQMTNAPAMELTLTTSENKISDIFTFSNVAAAWADNKYTETIDVTINWERADGTTLPLGTHAITYKRNATTVVNVKIENDGADGGLGFEIDESETGEPIADGENDVTIEDGEVVDTDVDTNGSGGSNEESESASIPNNQIWYTATAKVEPRASADFGATIESNEWDSTTGKGIITFDGDITLIGVSAFGGCNSLTSVTIPNSAISIEENAFYVCSGLTSVTIGDNVTSIGDSAFGSCSSLTSVTIGDSVTSIGDSAFVGCNSLTSVTIPNSVTSIGMSTFRDCSDLTSVTIGDNVTSIGFYAFSGCDNLTSFNGKFASADNRCLIIDGVLYSFAPAVLTEYIIPNSVTSIDSGVFHSLNLTSITIPDSVIEIGGQAFRGCSYLTSVYCNPINPPTMGAGAFHDNATDRKIYVPSASVDAYRLADGWKNYADHIVADE